MFRGCKLKKNCFLVFGPRYSPICTSNFCQRHTNLKSLQIIDSLTRPITEKKFQSIRTIFGCVSCHYGPFLLSNVTENSRLGSATKLATAGAAVCLPFALRQNYRFVVKRRNVGYAFKIISLFDGELISLTQRERQPPRSRTAVQPYLHL